MGHGVCPALCQGLQVFIARGGDDLRGKNAIVQLWHVLSGYLSQQIANLDCASRVGQRQAGGLSIQQGSVGGGRAIASQLGHLRLSVAGPSYKLS